MKGAPDLWPFVVAKVLSSSEIFLKDYKVYSLRRKIVVYSHRIYGTYGEKWEAQWMPIGRSVPDAGIYLQELKSGAIDLKIRGGHGFKTLEFRHKRKAIFRG